jgi:hypothetical protein
MVRGEDEEKLIREEIAKRRRRRRKLTKRKWPGGRSIVERKPSKKMKMKKKMCSGLKRNLYAMKEAVTYGLKAH